MLTWGFTNVAGQQERVAELSHALGTGARRAVPRSVTSSCATPRGRPKRSQLPRVVDHQPAGRARRARRDEDAWSAAAAVRAHPQVRLRRQITRERRVRRSFVGLIFFQNGAPNDTEVAERATVK